MSTGNHIVQDIPPSAIEGHVNELDAVVHETTDNAPSESQENHSIIAKLPIAKPIEVEAVSEAPIDNLPPLPDNKIVPTNQTVQEEPQTTELPNSIVQ
jgi:hypothetical protein